MEWIKENMPACYMTVGLAVVNIFIFIIFEIIGSNLDGTFMLEHGAMYTSYMGIPSQYYRFFTAMFLHFGIQHLLNNMILLCALGNYLEPLLGHVKFLILYLVSGVLSNVTSYAVEIHMGNSVISAGASGAIFSLLGGLLWIMLRKGGKVETLTLPKLLVLIGLSLYFGLVSQGVDNIAHLSGLIFGFLCCMVLFSVKKEENPISN